MVPRVDDGYTVVLMLAILRMVGWLFDDYLMVNLMVTCWIMMIDDGCGVVVNNSYCSEHIINRNFQW